MPPGNSLSHEQSGRRNSVLPPTTPAAESDADEWLSELPNLPNRHWSALQDHANHLSAIPNNDEDDGRASPGPEVRREGFTWESTPNPHTSSSVSSALRRSSIREPKGSGRSWGYSSQDGNGNGGYGMVLPGTQFPQKLRSSTSSSLEYALTRDTTRHSSLSSLHVSPRRAVPDIRMFAPDAPETPIGVDPRAAPKPITKAGRSLTMRLTPALKRNHGEEKTYDSTTKRTQFSGPSTGRGATSETSKAGIKERRHIDHGEAMKLTLPLKDNELVEQGRNLMMGEMAGNVTQPRCRSPKTPWVRRTVPTWKQEEASAQASALNKRRPERRSKDYIQSGFQRARTRRGGQPLPKKTRDNGPSSDPTSQKSHGGMATSDASSGLVHPPDGTTSPQNEAKLERTSAPSTTGRKPPKLPKIWPWSSGRTSTTGFLAVYSTEKGFTLSRIFKKKQACPDVRVTHSTPVISSEPPTLSSMKAKGKQK